MKKIFLPSIIASIVLIGCGGGGGGSNSSNSTTSIKEVKDIDAYIVGARVCDAKGICGDTDEKGTARANFDLNTTLTSVGGFIDANFNGIKDADELDAPLLLAPPGATVISPLTTLVAKGVDIDKLSTLLGVTPDEILHTDPFETNNVKLVKAFNAAYPVIKENKIDELKKKINNYNSSFSTTDLPVMGEEVDVNFYYLAKSVLTDPNDIVFIDEIENISEPNVKLLSEKLENLKKEPVKPSVKPEETNLTTENNLSNFETNTISSEINSTKNQSSASFNSNNSASSQTTDLPVMNNNSNSQSKNTLTSSVHTDLPVMDDSNYQPKSQTFTSTTDLPIMSENVELIPTNNEYNPSYSPLPKRYFVKLNEFNEFVEVKKDNDKKYEFKNIKYFNVANGDFNASTLFDINASYVYNDLNFTPDGNLKGTIFVNLKDLNDSSEVNFTITNVVFKVINHKVKQTDLTNVNIDVNSSCGVKISKTINAGNNTEFDVNLSKALVDYNESEFNQTNHDYSFEIDYNVSGNILSLLGKYGVVNAVVPTIALNQNSFIVPKNSDINVSVGKSNVANLSCSVDVDGVSLKCYVDNSKNIYLYGKTPNKEALEVVTLTLDNQGYKTSKSFYLEILKPADKIVVKNWDLKNDGNYIGNHIALYLNGNLDNNIVDVNTSATPVAGSPENNVTVYLFNKENDTNNYVRFIFDANVYNSNDVFVIKRGDGKKVQFRVGDIDISNNTFYFK